EDRTCQRGFCGCVPGVQRLAAGEDGKREGSRDTQAHESRARAARATSSQRHDRELQVEGYDGPEMVVGRTTVGQPTVNGFWKGVTWCGMRSSLETRPRCPSIYAEAIYAEATRGSSSPSATDPFSPASLVDCNT